MKVIPYGNWVGIQPSASWDPFFKGWELQFLEKYQPQVRSTTWSVRKYEVRHEKYLDTTTTSTSLTCTWSRDLVGGWTNPSEKYQSNWIISPRIGLNMLKITYIWNHLVIGWCSGIFILVYKVIAEYNWVPYVSSQQHYSQGSPFGGHCWQSGQWSSLQ